MAARDPRIMAVTPAMREGSGLVEFEKKFPERYFDVGIAEQHAVTFAAGLACEGAKPIVAIYSSFLQRGYDQLVHDVALQNLPVVFAIDRAGLVGGDGATHQGSYDLSFLRCIPNMVVMAPSNEDECRQMLFTATTLDAPAAVRYPRGSGPGVAIQETMRVLPLGRGVVLREGRSGLALLAFGSLVASAERIGAEFDATVVDMRYVKPIDEELIARIAAKNLYIVTLEENVVAGGAGSAVGEVLTTLRHGSVLLHIGIPDKAIQHGRREDCLADAGLDLDALRVQIDAWWRPLRPQMADTAG
jgi:1-deoxy-D-xylulose-5-phosphate synthase